jgi:magnesium transporter
MIRTYCFMPDEEPRMDFPVKDYSTYLSNPKALLWVDFIGEPDPSAEAILTGIFRFHPLAVDDALQETHTPKVDDWSDYLYIVLNAITIVNKEGLEAETKELDVFLGRNFVVTHHDSAIPAVEKAWQAILTDRRYTSHGPDHLLYKIIDDLVTDYWPMVEMLDAEIDSIEDRVFENAKPDLLERMLALKRILVTIRRVITPQREVLNRLAPCAPARPDRVHARPDLRHDGSLPLRNQQPHGRGDEDPGRYNDTLYAHCICHRFFWDEFLPTYS